MFYPRIRDVDRVDTVNKCNRIEKELEYLHRNKILEQQSNRDKDSQIDYYEKKELIDSIKNIVNDLSFQNHSDYKKLLKALKEIHSDIKKQQELLKYTNKDNQNELVTMLIQRIINDSAVKSIDNSELNRILELEKNNKEVLEKYIVKTIKKQLKKQKNKYTIESQDINILKSDEIKKKMDLVDLTIDKLNSMENLYNKVHTRYPENKKKIISIVKKPVVNSIRPYLNLNEKPIANTIYIKE